ncbi:hypothetical protein QBC37DRAFT_41751 [Rhypophila decipiens]|uniref:TauD/TfdA-like domain-containing protein n=1 Tax=Rhypophila decipiens TaxID=261697 RepID=A0AAN7B4T9_9PEZI|nr:hypothetical protein QBC37DRAFT_41751 [Rhypophila decipiens]
MSESVIYQVEDGAAVTNLNSMKRFEVAQSMLWNAEDMMAKTKPSSVPPYVVIVDSHEEAREVDSALKRSKQLDGNSINPTTFSLPSPIRLKLEEARGALFHGRGFVVIRLGVDLKSYTEEEKVTLFLGVASYLCDEIGVQDKTGAAITHVTSARHWTVPSELRHGIHTASALAFHSDVGCDILALHCRSQAEKGGHTYLASALNIYRDLLTSYPDCLDTLTQPAWPIQIAANPPRHILAPLIQVSQGKVWISVDPGRLGLHPVTAQSGIKTDIPELTPRQHEALRVLNSLASKHRLRLETRPGDMVFISNWSHLHARDAFEDPIEGPPRHLVRLWMRDSKLSWSPVPESMRVPWEAAYGNDLIQRRFPAYPARKYKTPAYTAGSAAFMLEEADDVNCETADSEATSG